MHTYTIDNTNTLHILVDGKETFAHGPFATKEEANAWAKNVCDLYNDATHNPKGYAFPKDVSE
jgi:hypothetical protein